MSFLDCRRIRIAFFVLAAVASAIPAVAQMDFYTLTPCRIYDSRPGVPLSSGTTYPIQVTGACSVPAEAQAVALNVTIFGASADGSLVVYPDGTTPPAIEMLPFTAGKTKAILQMVKLGTNGKLSFQATPVPPTPGLTYHIIFDVSGYYLNTPPMLTAGGVLNYTENDPPTAVDTTITVTDPDDTSLQSATVQITGNYQNGQDVLSLVSPTTPSITGVFTAATGTLALTGADTLANWQTALRSVLYENTSNSPSTLTRTVTWIANDGAAQGAPVTSTINVTATNDAPMLTAGGGATPTFTEGGGAVIVDGGITVSDDDDTDLESATVTITNFQDGASEVLAATACAGLTVTPSLNSLSITGSQPKLTYQTCLRSVTYENTSSSPNETQRNIDFKVNDGDADSNLLSRPVNLASTNNQPTISAIADQTIAEDTSTGALAFTVGDAETPVGSLTVSGSSSDTALIPNANIVFGGSGASRTVTVTPAADANGGPVTITITVDDGSGAPNATATETFTVTVTGANDQPTISAIADLTIDEDTSTGALAFTVGDAETAVASLAVSGSSSDTTLIPNANIVFGGSGASRTVTVTPAANLSGGPVTITITVDDGSAQPNSTAAETFTVTVTAVNDQPTISDVGDQTINEDTSTGPLAFTVGDQETPVASLTVSGSSSNPAIIPNGNIVFGGSGANRTVTVTPAANASGGPVTITITVDDGSAQPNSTASDTFTVTITAVNDQPTITPIADQTINEDTSTGALAFTVGDVETAVASLTVSGSSSDTTLIPNGNIVFGGSGASRTVTVTPAANLSGGPVTITVTVDDGSGQPNSTVTETFTVTVTNVNDQPTISAIADQTIDEDTSTSALAFTVGDQETPVASLTLSGSSSNTALIPNANIVFGGSGASRTVTVTPAANAFGGPVTITITVDDGSAQPNSTAVETFTVTINSVNDQPTITPIADQVIDEDTSTGALAFTIGDVETAPGSLTIGGSSSDTTLIPNGNIVFGGSGASRTVTVTPAPNLFGGPVTITVTVNDGSGAPNATVVETFTVTVNPVNDAPMFVDPTIGYSIPGNTQLRAGEAATGASVVHVRDNQDVAEKSTPSDIDGPAPPFIYSLGVAPANGQATVNSDGTFTYEPNAGFAGPTDSFTVNVSDGGIPAGVSAVTVTVTIAEMVWYVHDVTGSDNPAAGDDGRSTNAFEVLQDAINAAGPDDYVFVFRGNTGVTPHAPATLTNKDGLKLYGQGFGLSVPGFPNLVPAGSEPNEAVIQNAAATGAEDNALQVTINAGTVDGVEIRGFEITATDNAIDVTVTGAATAGVTISNNNIGTGTLEGIDVNHGSTSTASTLAVHDNVLLTAGNAIDIARTAGTLKISAFDDNVVSGDTNASGIVVTGPNIIFDANPGTGTLDPVSGGNTFIGASGNPVAGSGLVLSQVSGSLSFTDLDIYAGGTSGSGLVVLGTGAFTGVAGTNVQVTPAAPDGIGTSMIDSDNGAALDIASATIDLRLADLDSNTSIAGVNLNSVGGQFRAPSGSSISKTSGGGTAFSVASSVSGTTVTYAGSLNVTSGGGVSLSSNGGSTISFSGPLTLSTGANAAFSATGGGTVTATDTTSTLTTGTGTALNVASTTIGGAGIKFQSISANGAANGITLSSTGTSGGLVVSGTGSAGSGGTIQNITNRGASFIDAAGIELNWMNFTNAATTNGGDPTNASSTCGDLNVGGNLGCNAPVHLVNVTGIGGNPGAKLNRLNINGSAQVGININNVTGLNLTNATLTGIGNQVREFGLKGRNLKGTVSISGVSITGSFGENFRVENNDPSAVVTVSGSTFDSSTQGGGFFYLAQDDAQIDVTVTGSSFSSNFTTGLLVGVNDPSSTSTCTADLDATGGPFNNNNAGIQVISAGAADTTFNIHDIGSISGNPASGIALDEADNSTSAGSMIGRIQNNVVTQPLSGSGNGIGVTARGSGTTTIAVTGNTVTNRTQYGIFLHRKEGVSPGILNATVTGNNVTTADVNGDLFFPIDGIRVEAGATAADTGTLCAQISSNTSDGAQTAADNTSNFDLKLRHRFGVTYRLPGLVGSTGADAISLMNTNNPAVDIIDATTTSSYTGGAACPTPP